MRLFREKKWPHWISETQFKTPNLSFETQVANFKRKTSEEVIQLLKPRRFLETYDRYAKDAKRILEIGFFQGGMPLYFADTTKAEKIVAVDFGSVPDPVSQIIASKGLSSRVSLYGTVDQANTERMREILLAELGDHSLDLVTDDASHRYEPTKRSFETCFSYLRPGGVFIIEDWGWSHWGGGKYVKQHKLLSTEPVPLSQLILEIVLAQSAQPELIRKVEVIKGMVIITRGEGLKHGEHFALDELTQTWPIAFLQRPS